VQGTLKISVSKASTLSLLLTLTSFVSSSVEEKSDGEKLIGNFSH
jgi:hypothetical protein